MATWRRGRGAGEREGKRKKLIPQSNENYAVSSAKTQEPRGELYGRICGSARPHSHGNVEAITWGRKCMAGEVKKKSARGHELTAIGKKTA